jgi:penicillin-binding protein 1C
VSRIRKITGWVVALILISLSIGIFYVFVLVKDLPKPEQFGARQISQSTKIYDRTGKVLLYEIHGDEKRTVVPFEEIPNHLKWATIAAEDAHFYSHPAFNLKAILRAFVTNITRGEFSQGGSTITQQLAKNLFLTPEKTISRKIKEIFLAIELESQYSKDKVLELYLNQIPYGSNAYGVEAASQIYFNKSVRRLNLAEAAVLASLPQAPSHYSPWGNRQKELFKRQNSLLKKIHELGYISENELNQAIQNSQKITFAPPVLGVIKAPHFVLTVKDILVNRYGEEIVEKGGLKVITTLDWEMQEIAERVVKEGAERNDQLYQGKNAALVAQNPKTGQILALVGSRNYYVKESLPQGCIAGVNCGFEPKFNVAIQGLRQPGSALKPFAYLTAFKKGYPPKTAVIDAPTEFVSGDPECPPVITPFSDFNPSCFNPDNFDNRFRGPVSFERALAESINVPSVKVLYLAGFDDVLKTLANFGLTTLKERARYGLSLVLGGGEVKLTELVNAYAALAQEGILHQQKFILKAEDSKGNILEEYKDEASRVMESQYPKLINQILSDVELRSGLFQASLGLTIFPDREVALKTGTTNDYRDAWAIGYTPSLAVGIWAGNNDNQPMQRHGGSILAAVPIWNAFLKEVLPKLEPETFTKPEPLPLPSKPMLNGEAVYLPVVGGAILPQLHTILYYIDKTDPLGPVPENPHQNPQFTNWEIGVAEWAKYNVPLFHNYNQPIPRPISFESSQLTPSPTQGSLNNISIQIKNIKNGDFVTEPLLFEADIISSYNLSIIEFYLNRRLIERRNAIGNFHRYSYRINFLNPQNLIELKIRDQFGNAAETSLIVFR